MASYFIGLWERKRRHSTNKCAVRNLIVSCEGLIVLNQVRIEEEDLNHTPKVFNQVSFQRFRISFLNEEAELRLVEIMKAESKRMSQRFSVETDTEMFADE